MIFLKFKRASNLRVTDQGTVESSEFSENSETSENLFSEVFHSEVSVLHYTQFSLMQFDQTPSFSFCTILITENSGSKT